MYGASFFKRVVNIPGSLCLVVGGRMSGALYLGGVLTVNPSNLSRNVAKSRGSFYFSRNSQRNNCSCKMGCYRWIFSCNLQCNVCCVASVGKFALCNMTFTVGFLASQAFCAKLYPKSFDYLYTNRKRWTNRNYGEKRLVTEWVPYRCISYRAVTM